MTKKKRRSAIVPNMILSATIMTGAAVVPMLSGCGDRGLRGGVATVGFDGGGGGYLFDVAWTAFDGVAFVGFDMSVPDLSVAAQTFDLADDAESHDG